MEYNFRRQNLNSKISGYKISVPSNFSGIYSLHFSQLQTTLSNFVRCFLFSHLTLYVFNLVIPYNPIQFHHWCSNFQCPK